MDVTAFLEIRPAPRAVFDRIEKEPARRDMPRFHVRDAGVAESPWRPVTWGAFADEIRHMALHLAAFGLQPGERAAVYAPNRVEWASAALAIQAAAGVMVPVYPASTVDQLAYVLSHSDARVVFVDTAPLLARVVDAWPRCPALERIILLRAGVEHVGDAWRAGDTGDRIIAWADAIASGRSAHERDPEVFERRMDGIDLDQPGCMLYTSGTSGAPKGVPLTHRNVGANGSDWMRCNGPALDEGMSDILWLPMSHIFGFGEMCLGNTLGFTTYMATPAEALDLLPAIKPSVFMSVPAYWEKLARAAMVESEPEARLARLRQVTGGDLRFCLSGGAGLKQAVKELFHQAGMLIIEGYGLTETAPTLTLNRPDDFRFDSVGKALPSVELRLADDGEILARGPNVFAGYHKDPKATAEAFDDDGWFHTGDIGRFTEDGFLQIVDRKKDILVTAGGKNVPPANIEMRFRDDPLIEHVVVYGDGKKYLVAGIWVNHDAVAALSAPDAAGDAGSGSAGSGVDEWMTLIEQRVAAVNETLARFETIKRFRVMNREPAGELTVENGLVTASLKIRRKKIYDAFRSEFEALYNDA